MTAATPALTGDRAADLASGKGHRDENFPVASVLLKREHRAPVMAFYRFARAADDIADNPAATPASKLALLEAMRATIAGESDAEPTALALRRIMAERSLDPRHALDLLEAFRRDVTVDRYASWDDLIDYCSVSAMPVGRFVLDVHGESRATWPASDALCAALQIINHLQDCGSDYRTIHRSYIPTDALAAAGCDEAELGATRCSPALLAVIHMLARRTQQLLADAAALSPKVVDTRLALEIAIIQRLAEDLAARLTRQDPLAVRVRHGKVAALGLALRAAVVVAVGRFTRR